jgi:hypothetical protein
MAQNQALEASRTKLVPPSLRSLAQMLSDQPVGPVVWFTDMLLLSCLTRFSSRKKFSDPPIQILMSDWTQVIPI